MFQFPRFPGLLITLALCGLLSACSTQTVKTANHTPLQRDQGEIAEQHLLDVGIQVFDDGLDIAPDDEDLLIFPEVRKAESRFMPYMLMEALQASAAWGAVRVVPNEKNVTDVRVQGKILHSDGEIMLLLVTVTDASGRIWFTREYEGNASRYAYDRRRGERADPFQSVYHAIANDMLAYRDKLENDELAHIRTVSELRFAQSFSPDAFGGYLEQNKKGEYDIVRLPAANDPMLQRVYQIRERDYLFVDTLQDYYTNLVREMDQPYQAWRRQTYDEVIAMRRLQRAARNRTIAGIASVLGGIAAVGSNNPSARVAGQVGVIGGGYLVKSGFDKRAQAKIHVEALQELGDSLEAEIEPHVIELEDQTITLSGTVENQYDQWRELLRDIYRLDTGGVE